MVQPIYKLWQARFTETWHQLPQDEQQRLLDEAQQSLTDAGGTSLMLCSAAWSNEEWPYFGLEQFPDLDAVQKHSQRLTELNWFRYLESRTTLGTQFPTQP